MKKLIAVIVILSVCSSFAYFGAVHSKTASALATPADSGCRWQPMNNGLYGGNVHSLAIDPLNTQTLYTEIYGIGVFKSTDGGSSWSAVNNGFTNNWVYSLAIDPSNTQVIYTGTGRGIFKSTDGGSHWSAVNNGFTNNWVYSLAIDPNNTNIIYAGTSGGVYKSTDGGSHWSSTGLTNTKVLSLAINSNNTNIIYAGTDSGVFKSTDSGAHWHAINNGLTNTDINSLVINPMNTNIIYVGTLGGIFKSTNGGAHWHAINNGLTNTDINSLVINPMNTNIIYVGTLGGVFKSTDGGSNWNAINNGLTNTDVESLAINPSNTQVIYAGTWGGGVFKWAAFLAPPQNLSATLDNTNKSIILSWNVSTKGTYPIAGYAIYRGRRREDFLNPIATVDANTTTYTDKTVEIGVPYYYAVKAFDNQIPPDYSKPSNEVIVIVSSSPPPVQKTVIILQPDNPMMTVNGVQQEIDPGRGTKPVIIPKWSRTVVPIRAIVEALGGTISWDPTERKVTINFNDTVIELWIGKPQAEVNGVTKWIDLNNHDVRPVIINDRTMLPLRFVAESLGCTVNWDQATRTITITYDG